MAIYASLRGRCSRAVHVLHDPLEETPVFLRLYCTGRSIFVASLLGREAHQEAKPLILVELGAAAIRT